ncbi:urease accessory protein UreF [Hydrocarboniphaga sp.]|uniref:urease accessory protein UreF n=1 Tax=Hydrocarboniphaga sp. TaxID=2033016 RepID=UPI003D0DC0EC
MNAEQGDLYRLLVWTSPSYPIGAFSYSHGLEWAVEEGSVDDVQSLVDYIGAVLERGGAWVDAVLFAQAHRNGHDEARLDHISELATAFRASAETALEARQQGAAFLLVTRRAWPHPLLDAFAARHENIAVTHCVTMALACAAHGLPLVTSLAAFLHSVAANLVSAGVRLVPLGQTDGQIALATLADVVSRATAAAMTTDIDDLGTASPALEFCSMHHETQYTRLFRS